MLMPFAPGGLSTRVLDLLDPGAEQLSSQSSDAVPTMAGIARSHWPGRPVDTLNPAGSPLVTSSSRWTRQPSVVPTMSSASPSVPGWAMPPPNPQAGKSNGPGHGGAGRQPEPLGGVGAQLGRRGPGPRWGPAGSRWLSPMSSSVLSL